MLPLIASTAAAGARRCSGVSLGDPPVALYVELQKKVLLRARQLLVQQVAAPEYLNCLAPRICAAVGKFYDSAEGECVSEEAAAQPLPCRFAESA